MRHSPPISRYDRVLCDLPQLGVEAMISLPDNSKPKWRPTIDPSTCKIWPAYPGISMRAARDDIVFEEHSAHDLVLLHPN